MSGDGEPGRQQQGASGGAVAPRRPSSWWRRLLIALLPLLVLLSLTELLLRVFDLGRVALPGGAGFSRGFDPAARQLVADRSQRGAWRTHLFEGRPEVFIPPRDGRRRVLLVGGSNTQLFPEELLQRLLDEAEPAGWEVINLGREGYGSRRVLNLLDEAMVLEPDVVVVYCGHNEFIERVFEQELQGVWGAPWQLWLAERLSGLRLFGLLVDALAPLHPPAALERVEPEGREIPWEETLQRYAAYEANLEALCRRAQAGGAQVVLCTLLWNVFSPPFASTWPEALPEADRAAADELRGSAQTLVPEDCRRGLRPPIRLRVQDWSNAVTARSRRPVVRLRELSGALAADGLPDDPETGAVRGALWPDPRLWNDPVLAVLSTMEALVARDLDEREQAQLVQARRMLEHALSYFPENPAAHFDLGLLCWLQGDLPGAVGELKSAANNDRSPGAANDRINAIVRSVAARLTDVVLLDVEAWLAPCTPDGLVGYETMMDACHLQPGVRGVLMHRLADELLARRGRAAPGDGPGTEVR